MVAQLQLNNFFYNLIKDNNFLFGSRIAEE